MMKYYVPFEDFLVIVSQHIEPKKSTNPLGEVDCFGEDLKRDGIIIFYKIYHLINDCLENRQI